MDTGALKTRRPPGPAPCAIDLHVCFLPSAPTHVPRGAWACPPGTWVPSEPQGQEAAVEERGGPYSAPTPSLSQKPNRRIREEDQKEGRVYLEHL